MREISEIHFTTGGKAANRRLMNRYVLEAVDRLPSLEFCDRVAFMPLTHRAVDGGNLWLTVAGDREALVENESGEWDALVEEGVVSEWDVTDVTEDWDEKTGEQGGDELLRLHAIANQVTKAVYGEFDDPPAPVDAYPDEDSTRPIGWPMVLHLATAHLEYSFEEAADAFLAGIKLTYEDVSTFESRDEAVEHVDQAIHSLETFRDELKERGT
jgi:hypothetical protein